MYLKYIKSKHKKNLPLQKQTQNYITWFSQLLQQLVRKQSRPILTIT